MSHEKYKTLQVETNKDSELTLLKDVIMSGRPVYKNSLDEVVRKFWNIRDEVSAISS